MVNNLLSLLSKRQTSILSGAFILMVATFATKFLGLIRDRLLFHTFDSSTASIFFAAFNLPDFLFNILIFSALSVAFIPIFTEHLHKNGEKDAFSFANNILNLSLLVFGVVGVICFIFVSPINSLMAPGLSGPQKALTDDLTRIILLGQMLLIVGAFFIGISQSFQRFIGPSLAPLFYNVGLIIGIAFFSQWFGIAGPALGVVLGAVLHVLVQLPLVHSLGFRHKLSFNLFDTGVKEVLGLISFRSLGLVIEQISERVSFALSTLVAPSAPALLTASQHLFAVPIGLFGVTIAQAALPILSSERARDDMESFKTTLLTTLHQILFLALPAAAILIVLRIPVVRLTFGAQNFIWEDTILTGRTVAFLSVGLAAQSLVLLLVRAFYALKDTKTPVIVSLVTVVVNITLSFLFVKVLRLDVWSLGISYAIATNLSLVLLIGLLDKKVKGFASEKLIYPAIKMLAAAILSAVALYIPMRYLDQLIFDTTRTVNLILLTGVASLFGLTVYLLLVRSFKVKELETYGELLKKIYHVRVKIKEVDAIKEPTQL